MKRLLLVALLLVGCDNTNQYEIIDGRLCRVTTYEGSGNENGGVGGGITADCEVLP